LNATASTQERWVNPTIYTGVGIVAVYCVGVSGYWLVKLAGFCSMHNVLGFSVPVSLDVAGGIAALVWVKGSTKEARMWGAAIAVGTLLGSLGGNILAHLIEAGIVKVTPWLIIGVGSIPPIMLFLAIHLLIVSSNRPAPVARRVRQPMAIASEPPRSARTPAAPREATAPAAPTSPAAGASAPDPTPSSQGSGADPAENTNVRPISTGLSQREQVWIWFKTQVDAADGDVTKVTGPDLVAEFGAEHLRKKISDLRRRYLDVCTATSKAVND